MKIEEAKKVAEIVAELEYLNYIIDTLNIFIGMEELSLESKTNSVCIKGAMLYDIVLFIKDRFKEIQKRKMSSLKGM